MLYFDYEIKTDIKTKISSLYISNHNNTVVLNEEFIKTAIINIYVDNNKEINYGRLNIYVDNELWITTDYQMSGFEKIFMNHTINNINTDELYVKFNKSSF